MAKRIKWIVLALCLFLALGALLLTLAVFVPYRAARSTMAGQGVLRLSQDASGKLTLRWAEAEGVDCYCLEVLLAQRQGEQEQVIHREYITGSTQCVLPVLPLERQLTLRISSVVKYSVFGQERLRFGDCPLSVTGDFSVPAVTQLRMDARPDEDKVTLTYTMRQGDVARMYLVREDGTRVLLKTLQAQQVELSFGEGGDLPMPERGQACELAFDAYRLSPGMEFAGAISAEVAVTREDLLNRDLNVRLTDEGQNVCRLRWAETKGEYYELQMRRKDDPRWTVIRTYQADEEREYVSPHLPSRNEYQFRVVAVGGETIEGSEYAAVSEDVAFHTAISPIFCTVWPVKELDAYSDAQKTKTVGAVSACKAYCVLDEKNGMFGVRLNDQICYIDSSYCMIDLPEYLGDLCAYDVTNSYRSIYMVHEFLIPKVTDEVIAGYEHVRMADGEFLVPLLYPTAKKLCFAAEAAMDQGYRLKIYDAFRPNKATRRIYSLTEKILDDAIPEKPHTSKNVEKDLEELRKRLSREAGAATAPEQTGEAENQITYRLLMTNDEWQLYNFLAQGGSYHNLGVALDLTLERLDTGVELEMQTAMHDLSCYSVLERNDDNADRLARIMKSAGMGELISEWWHFQDDEAINTLKLPWVADGVSPEGWTADDTGWRYRLVSGAFASNCTIQIDGKSRTFDADGYVTP